jgi:hypothetical protein
VPPWGANAKTLGVALLTKPPDQEEVARRMMEMMAPPPDGTMSDEERAKWESLLERAREGKALPGGAALDPSARSPVGQPAPDFTIMDVRTGKEVSLRDLKTGRPLVLVFGSWGCNVFCTQFDKVAVLEKDYRGKADFVYIQIADAPHPLPQAVADALAAAGISNETAANRRERAALSAEAMGLRLRHLLDTQAGDAGKKYRAWPQRLYIVSGDEVVHDTGPGLMTAGGGWRFDRIRDVLDATLAAK